MGADHEHRVCTYAEAEASIRRAKGVWVNDCFGCSACEHACPEGAITMVPR